MGLLTETELAGGGIGAEEERGGARRRDEMGVDSVYAAACGGGRIHFPIRNLKKRERERENDPIKNLTLWHAFLTRLMSLSVDFVNHKNF